MKFDVIVGNPPYQESQSNNNKGEAIYNYFYDLSENMAPKYCLITPARFLFNGGLTSKKWNKKMLKDKHLKIEYYSQSSKEVFPNTDIKGGIVIVYRDCDKNFGAINHFIPNKMLRGIASKFDSNSKNNLSSIIFGGRSALKFNDLFIEDYPDSPQRRLNQIKLKYPEVNKLGVNEEYELKSSTFDSLDYVFLDSEPNESNSYWKLLGLYNNDRTYRWINRKYMDARYSENNNLLKYKVFVPKANGSGVFGETISSPMIGTPLMSSTPTFISIGSFDSEIEAINLLKYIKTKFVRTLLSILKVTQDNPPSKWSFIPIQNFKSNSNIDWSKKIYEIDEQLYNEYSLTHDEIEFIENNVKPMT